MFLVGNFTKIELFLRYFDIFIVQSGVWENKTFYSIDISCGRLLLLFSKP